MANHRNLPIFLKSIHIQGFKSFADKIKLELGQGLSVIVGPNGSGKSNIADAVRWVIGEQSAKSLRGTKMEDIIFAGSSQRRPVGMAEVALVFDNTTGIFPLDYNEVTISRKVYRDGEGEYAINHVPCRLKDIHELFMDTGAGKEGFSIIGQGRVEEILSAKADERRVMIEEAAGITKYRSRKKETVKRLEDTDRNLQRLEDILAEIETQLGPLAIQAEKATSYQTLQQEQYHLEVRLTVKELETVENRLNQARKQAESLQEILAQSMAQLAENETNYAGKKQALSVLDEKMHNEKETIYRFEQEFASKKHELALQEERRSYQREQSVRLETEITEMETKQKELKKNLHSCQERQAVIRRTLTEEKSRLQKAESQLAALRAENDDEIIVTLKEELFNALTEQTEHSNKLTGIRHSLSAQETQKNQLEKEKFLKEQEYIQLQDSRRSAQAEWTAVIQREEENEAKSVNLRTRQLEIADQMKATETALADSLRLFEKIRAKRQALQGLEDSLEGYHRGVRELMLGKKKGTPELTGLFGTVAELLTVPQSYELAIETALGGGLQNIVADTEASAKAGIAYLKKRQLGRATFLPVDTLQPGRFQSDLPVQLPGFVGKAIDLISFDEAVRPAMEFLLGRILVVTDLDAAVRAAKATGYKMKVVTLDGDQVNPGGSLTGGSSQRQTGHLLGRTREINELSRQMAEAEAAIAREKDQIGQWTRQKQEHEETGRNLERERQGLREQLVTLKTTMANMETQIARLGEDASLTELRLKDLQEQEQAHQKNLAVAQDGFDQSEQRIRSLRETLQKREQAMKTVSADIAELSEKVTQVKVGVARLEQEQAQTTASLAQEEAKERELSRTVQTKIQELHTSREMLAVMIEDEEKLRIGIKDWETKLLQFQFQADQTRNERSFMEAGLAELDHQVNALRRKVQEQEQKLHQNELNVVRYEADWDSGITKLAEDYGITWQETSSFRDIQPKAELNDRLRQVKAEIEQLGPVNQAALEEYPKLSERKEFLSSQRADLLDAREKLSLLISELDKTMSERFAKGFAAVNLAFQEVFRELFNGGQAELRLLAPEDLLETGVEIVAQPPGKKPQWLSLLSGGEKALTAIALLFALLKVKPSPFCLLDEIEASLDDANVRRFSRYLQKLSAFTQFIVISHRKGTMVEADLLYGVSMQESGVSKLLTVALKDLPEDSLAVSS